MGEDSQEREEGGRFKPSVTLEDVLDVFEAVEGPAITSSDVAERHDCTPQTAHRKLDELEAQGRVNGRESAGRTIWWRIEDSDEEVKSDE